MANEATQPIMYRFPPVPPSPEKETQEHGPLPHSPNEYLFSQRFILLFSANENPAHEHAAQTPMNKSK